MGSACFLTLSVCTHRAHPRTKVCYLLSLFCAAAEGKFTCFTCTLYFHPDLMSWAMSLAHLTDRDVEMVPQPASGRGGSTLDCVSG
jgi:hypothetical protein